jgi:hypothetical protein
VAVSAPAHVDDRDVEGADVADEVERFLPRRRLVDDETVLEGTPDPQPDEGVAVDNQTVWGLAQDCFRSDGWGRGDW